MSTSATGNPYLTAMVLMPLSLVASYWLVFCAGDHQQRATTRTPDYNTAPTRDEEEDDDFPPLAIGAEDHGRDDVTPSLNITNKRDHLYWAVCRVAAFYCGWALYKRLFMGDKNDMGHITMGFLSVVSFFQRPNLTLFAISVVWLHYALAAYLVFVEFPSAEALAEAVKKSTTAAAISWAWTLRIYVVANICFWFLVLRKAYPLLQSSLREGRNSRGAN